MIYWVSTLYTMFRSKERHLHDSLKRKLTMIENDVVSIILDDICEYLEDETLPYGLNEIADGVDQIPSAICFNNMIDIKVDRHGLHNSAITINQTLNRVEIQHVEKGLWSDKYTLISFEDYSKISLYVALDDFEQPPKSVLQNFPRYGRR